MRMVLGFLASVLSMALFGCAALAAAMLINRGIAIFPVLREEAIGVLSAAFLSVSALACPFWLGGAYIASRNGITKRGWFITAGAISALITIILLLITTDSLIQVTDTPWSSSVFILVSSLIGGGIGGLVYWLVAIRNQPEYGMPDPGS